jgi:choline transport protein
MCVSSQVCGLSSSGLTDSTTGNSTGLSTLIGILSPVFSFIGPDSAAHMAEEVHDASLTLPRVMLATTLVNGALGFVMLCTFCMLVGNVEDILATPTGQPFIQMFYNITQSKAGTSVMTSILIVMATFGCIGNVAASSRQIWAFARDGGLPCSGWLAHVSLDCVEGMGGGC